MENGQKSNVMKVYSRSPIEMKRGEGVYLYDKNNKKYLDFAAGIAVNSLGHGHPHLINALKKQMDEVIHVSNMYTFAGQEKMAKRLADISFADYVFFCSTGVESVETGLKMMRAYHDETGNANKYRVITIEGAFHGRSMATISASAKESCLKGYLPAMDGFDNVPFNDIEAVKNAICDDTAGILLEPVQGEGGIRVNSKEYLSEVRKICDENGLLLMFDEVQCGIGRLGKFFAYEYFGVVPDIISIAKGIGAGFPLGCCLATANACSGMKAGSHGSTFGGNPLAMAAGNAVLDIINQHEFLGHVQGISDFFRQELDALQNRHPEFIFDVRGLGLMLGVRVNTEIREFVGKLRENGLLTVPAGTDIVRILPPLTITKEDVKEAIDIFEKTIQES